MVFSSFIFILVFLPIVFALNMLIITEYSNVLLLLASLIFYAWGEPVYVLIMLATIIMNYTVALLIDKNGGRCKRFCLVKIIFPVDEILTARNEYSEYQYYLKLDTHWNYLGGYFGSVPLLNQLNAEVTDLSDLTIEEVNEPVFLWHGYDEADLLGLSDVLNEDVNYRISGGLIDSIVYEGDDRNNLSDFEGVVRTVSDSDDFRKVFFVRDSFGECMTPYLASSFHEVYSVHDDSFTKNMIDEEQPDIFIYESVERADFLGAFNYNNW